MKFLGENKKIKELEVKLASKTCKELGLGFMSRYLIFSNTFLETGLSTIRTTLIIVGGLLTQRSDGGEKMPKDRVKTR